MSKEREKRTTQWHPLFAELLRPLLQDYYEVQTNVPVGDAPREADIVLVRRVGNEPTPFRGLWRFLTTWNVIEFKGPSVAARLRDLGLLVELGLGIDRRLNEERRRQRQAALGPDDASFWYVVNRLGGRFLCGARQRPGSLEELEAGLWRSQILGHSLFLLSSGQVASEPDSVPLHLLLKRSDEQERELAHLVLEQPHYMEWYGQWLGTLHPTIWQEVIEMARKDRGIPLDFSAVKDDINIPKLLETIGVGRVMKELGAKRMIKEMGVDWLIANLPPDELKKLKERLK